MPELEFDAARWQQDEKGVWLCLRVLIPKKARAFCNAMKSGKAYIANIKLKRNRRSLDANAYFWVLCDHLAEETGIPKADIYREAIRDIGGNTEYVCVPSEGADKLCDGWRRNGIGWMAETMPSKIEGCTNVILYYGSSTFDSKQMSRLIDNIVQDCQAVGIETKTPDELALLKARWEDVQTNKSS